VTPEAIAASLTAPQRVLLSCVGSRTEWSNIRISAATIRNLLVRNLVERDAAGGLTLTDQGRAVLKALIGE
jgi:hypothetical protein